MDLGKQTQQATSMARLLSTITVDTMLQHKADRTVYEVRTDDPFLRTMALEKASLSLFLSLFPLNVFFYNIMQVREDEQTIKAVETMVSNNVGSVVVRSSETQLHIGLLSRLDCMRKLVLQQRFARETPVRDIMNDNVRIECPPPSITLTQPP